MDTWSLSRLPRLYEHGLVFAAFSLGVLAAGIASDEWEAILKSGGCFLAIAWFPSACLELFRRTSRRGCVWPALILSLIAGYDGVLRLVHQSASGC